MVPPWVPDPPTPPEPPDPDQGSNDDEAPEEDGKDGGKEPDKPSAPPPIPVAPKARFGGARRALGEFSSSGGSKNLRRGLGHYVRTGYGGSGTAARRFGGTASTASSLGAVLSGLSSGGRSVPGAPALNREALEGRSAREVVDAIVEAVRPIDGTQDAEAARKAINDALSGLLTKFPDADLLNLTDDQRAWVIENYVAGDVFLRIQLDVGKTVVDRAASARLGLQRLRQIKDYVAQTIAASFRKLASKGRSLTSGSVTSIVKGAVRETLEVFEGYTQ
jgi:hypothetical protein